MKICTRQVCFILAAYTVVTKLLMFPTILSGTCGRDLLFPAIINFTICAVVIWAVAFLCSKTDKTFFELLEGGIGNIGARIVYGFFALFFLFSSLIPVFEQKLYVHAIFYDTVPSLIVFLPIFIFLIYAGSKGFENIGRCADICMPIFLGVMLIIFVMAFGEAKLDNLLPILKSPGKSILSSSLGTSYVFNEPCWLLMFMGHFKYKKGDAAKITLSYVGGALTVLCFLAAFCGIYGSIAASRTFAVSRVSLFFPAIDMLGRIDLILLYVLEIVMLFALAINVQLSVHAVSKCTGYSDRNIISLAVSVILAVVLIVCDHKFQPIYKAYFKWLWIATVIFAVVIPVLAWAFKRRKTRDEK